MVTCVKLRAGSGTGVDDEEAKELNAARAPINCRRSMRPLSKPETSSSSCWIKGRLFIVRWQAGIRKKSCPARTKREGAPLRYASFIHAVAAVVLFIF